MPPRIPPLFTPALQRRIARASIHRPLPAAFARSLHISPPTLAKIAIPRNDAPPIPSSPALSALLARLSLPTSASLHPLLLACLTHPSFSTHATSSPSSSSSASTSTNDNANNALLATLGNSLLGLFTSEHLSLLYPELPTEALKSAVTAFVGPKACISVARELGVSVSGQRSRERDRDGESRLARRKSGLRGGGADDEGVVIRYFRESLAASPEAEAVGKSKENTGFDDVVASVVRAFVGLIYQEQGIHAARNFTSSHFLSRHLDMTTLFSFKNPKHVLSSVIAKHLISAGVTPGSPDTRIESRVIASTGTHSQAPLFNIGLFLPSGLKLAEGHGSSLKMAEHRAATNALHSLFLVRSDAGVAGNLPLPPTSAHGEVRGLASLVDGGEYRGLGQVVPESVVESSRSRVRR